MKQTRLAIVGGGAAGFFAAINVQEACPEWQVVVFEASRQGLKKVRISGGGRCNVTHSCFEVDRLVQHYPRGFRELKGPFHRFGPQETIDWFRERGIELKTERDGRMFPISDQSQTIVDCFLDSATQAGVEIRYNQPVKTIQKVKNKFSVNAEEFDFVLLATGSSPVGNRLAEQLGHTLVSQRPSLFTFKVDDVELQSLAGVSVPARVEISIGEKKWVQEGPLLFVHWGLSGPAVLKLSALAARELFDVDYRCAIRLSFGLRRESLERHFQRQRKEHGKSKVFNQMGLNKLGVDLPRRLEKALLSKANRGLDCRWADLSRENQKQLVEVLLGLDLKMNGKTTFKEEFVTCGGVQLAEVSFQTMESRVCSGLFFAGEILDIDGVTGGFNFQNAWTGGWLAAQALARKKNKQIVDTD